MTKKPKKKNKNLGIYDRPGQPTKYRKEFVKKVDEYIRENQDEEIQILKQANEEKGYEMYENRLRVRLPTIESFSLYIDVDKKTLYNWARDHVEFFHALEKITKEQQKRLLENGLSGRYNSTIAKLVLSANHGMRDKVDVRTPGEDEPGTVDEEYQKMMARTINQYLDDRNRKGSSR